MPIKNNPAQKRQQPTEQKADYYKLCPNCGNFSHVDENEEYCTACGERLIQECPNCGEPIIYPLAKYCPKCGEEFVIGSNSKE